MSKTKSLPARRQEQSQVSVNANGYTIAGELAQNIQAIAAARGISPDSIVEQALREFAEGIENEIDFRLPPKLASKMDAEPEFEGCVPVQIQLPPELLQRARHHACHGSQYLSDWIRSLIELEDYRLRRLCSTHWQD